VHPEPGRAVSDGRQSLTFAGFEAMMAELRRVAEALDRTLPGPAQAAGRPGHGRPGAGPG
jgi:hypothetical protein